MIMGELQGRQLCPAFAEGKQLGAYIHRTLLLIARGKL